MSGDTHRIVWYNPRIVIDDREKLRAENVRLTAEVARQATVIASQVMLRGRFGRSTEKLLNIPETDNAGLSLFLAKLFATFGPQFWLGWQAKIEVASSVSVTHVLDHIADQLEVAGNQAVLDVLAEHVAQGAAEILVPAVA